MPNLQKEISRYIPTNVPKHFLSDGVPILTAFECAILERETSKSFTYTAVNLHSGRRELLERRRTPLTTNGVEAMVEKLRRSTVSGVGRMETDRRYSEQISFDKCKKILREVFKDVLPQYGYAVRNEQMALADSMLTTIRERKTSLAEAEVGTGKTHAYLVAAILAKRGRLNDTWNKSYYPEMSYMGMSQMPIVIVTSSIALQKAIVTDYIPELSRILLKNGIIKTPLTAVLRKGREHYVCERNLRSRLMYERNEKNKEIFAELLQPKASIDLADVDGLDSYTKRKISVPYLCDINCPQRNSCAYLKFRTKAMNPAIDIQVVNHNYFLADIRHRASGKRPLLPNYQTVIIDEAHKFLSAARTMYGVELSNFTLSELKESIDTLNYAHQSTGKLICDISKDLFDENRRLFKCFENSDSLENADDEATRFAAVIGKSEARHLRNLRNISNELYDILSSEPVLGNGNGKRSQILRELSNICEQFAVLTNYGEQICWLEKPDINSTPGSEQEILLCSIPKNLDKQLYKDLWSKQIPTILTSGTLSAKSDFSHIKRVLGLERLKNRLTETSKPSPFDYKENAMLYISENVPFPDNKSNDYIKAVADETQKLITASHGHAAVLFTSYKVMDKVWTILKKRGIPFPMFRLDKGGVMEIERFKQSAGGVLFASGALWEGIDIPGDALSMLIIVKLPFAVPDPISEYEQTLYDSMSEYKSLVILPEMLIKLKQGFGRLIRKVSDTGVVAILDIRAGEKGAYRSWILNALPDCRVTRSIADVKNFILTKKTSEYYI